MHKIAIKKRLKKGIECSAHNFNREGSVTIDVKGKKTRVHRREPNAKGPVEVTGKTRTFRFKIFMARTSVTAQCSPQQSKFTAGYNSNSV